MRTRAIAVAGCLIASFASANCTILASVIFHNHSHSILVLRSGAGAQEIEERLAPNAEVEIDGAAWRRLEITHGEDVWRYEWDGEPLDFIETSRWRPMRRVFRAQIEPDGRIYVLFKESQPPVHPLPPQPAGFPLVPVTGGFDLVPN